MNDAQPTSPAPVRSAEIASALCLATDLAMGFPWAHGLEATRVTMRLCDIAGSDDSIRKQAYFFSLLGFAGCTADATVKSKIYGGPITESIMGVIWGSKLEQTGVVLRSLPTPAAHRARAAAQTMMRLPRALASHPLEQLALCEVGQHMSRHLNLDGLVDVFHHLTDRWDGTGVLRRGKEEAIPEAVRLTLVARDAAYQAVVGGTEYAADVIASRAGKAHDPRFAMLLARHHREVLGQPSADGASWQDVLALEPGDPVLLAEDQIDDAVATLGEIADVVEPTWAGRSREVAALAAGAATAIGMNAEDVRRVRRSALLQDVGRVSVPPRAWQNGAISAHDAELVRLHPYYTERICSSFPSLSGLSTDAGSHHERLDGSGFHRGVDASVLGVPARILAAADAFRSACEPGPSGPGLSRSGAANQLVREVEAGRLDADCVSAVIEAAGMDRPSLPRPADLTGQEARVVGLIARGFATKQVADRLRISPKTADQHLQHAYRKIGVSSRAALALFAAENGLLAWGEFLIPS